MKKNLVLLVLLLFMVSPIFGDLKDLGKEIKNALKDTEITSSDMARLINKLASYDSDDAVEICIDIITAKDKRTSSIEGKLDKVKRELDKLRDVVTKQGGIYPDQQQEMRKLESEVSKLEDQLRSSTVAKSTAITVMYKMTSDSARQAMLKNIGNRDWRVAAACIDALGRQKWEGAYSTVLELYPADGKPHKEDSIRLYALQYFINVNPNKAKQTFIKALEDDSWLVRRRAVMGLEHIADKDCIDPLIKRISEETKSSLKYDIIEALEGMTDKDFGDNASNWRSWWSANRSKATIYSLDERRNKPRKEGKHKTTSFYDVPSNSNTPIFIIDQSGSMQAAADSNVWRKQAQEWLRANPGKNSIPPIPPPAGHKSKWEVLQRELWKAIEGLPEDGKFNIVWYSTDVQVYSERGMVDASSSNKKKVKNEIDAHKADGLTNIHDALKRAFELATGSKKGEGTGVITGEKKKDLELVSDTFFFMTDGTPTNGPISANSHPQQYRELLLERVKEWNAVYNIKINCIGVGECDETLLQAIAKLTGGKFSKQNKE